MTSSDRADDLPVLGELPPAQVALKLRALGDPQTADALEAALRQGAVPEAVAFAGLPWPFPPRLWQHTAHTFGYLAPFPPGTVPPQRIQHAGNIAADPRLKNARIKITLDGLRVASYPGFGIHHVLFDFSAQNQLPKSPEELHFNATYRIQDGERAAVVGYPVFVGLSVGTEGVAFKCFTVNVKSEGDQALLAFLDADVFQSGLQLLTAAQPAIKPLSAMAVGVAKALANPERNASAKVQDFYLGLDFGTTPTRARLAEGSYIVVQIPESLTTVWDWREWVYHPSLGSVVNAMNPGQLIPYNYILFSVSRYEGS